MEYKTVNGNKISIDKISKINYNISVYNSKEERYIHIGLVPVDVIDIFIESLGITQE